MDERERHALARFVNEVARRGPDRFSRALLFGSRARGEAREDSDADVAVVLRGAPGDFLATKLELADVAYDVLLETGFLIQPLPIWEDEWEHPAHHRNPRLVEAVRREGVPL